jgi:hypothetical protein
MWRAYNLLLQAITPAAPDWISALLDRGNNLSIAGLLLALVYVLHTQNTKAKEELKARYESEIADLRARNLQLEQQIQLLRK